MPSKRTLLTHLGAFIAGVATVVILLAGLIALQIQSFPEGRSFGKANEVEARITFHTDELVNTEGILGLSSEELLPHLPFRNPDEQAALAALLDSGIPTTIEFTHRDEEYSHIARLVIENGRVATSLSSGGRFQWLNSPTIKDQVRQRIEENPPIEPNSPGER